MMEPISLTCSILTLIATAKAIATTLGRLQSLRDAPKELFTLSKTIADLQSTLEYIDQELQSKTLGTTSSDHPLAKSVEHAKVKLGELDRQVHHGFFSEAGAREIRPSKVRWLREQKRIKILLDDIKSIRVDLTIGLSILNTYVVRFFELLLLTLATRSTLGHLQSALENVIIGQNEGRETSRAILQLLAHTSSQLSQIKQGHQDPNYIVVERSSQLIVSPTSSVDTEANPSQVMGSSKSSVRSLPVTRSQAQTSSSSRADLLVQLHSSSVSWRLCNPGCICHCHKRAFFALAEPWRQTFGRLSIGYVGSSKPSQACTVNGCRSRERSTFTLNYHFPSWFLARGIYMSLRAGHALSLDMKIRLPHVRHSSAKIFQYIDTVNVRGVQRLLSKREASPWDVDEDGWSLLRVSLPTSLQMQ